MTDNHKRTKEWLGLTFNNIKRVIRNYREKDYPICVFLIQLSIEQLQKALIFMLGLQFRKTHEPSKILTLIKDHENFKNEENLVDRIKKIVFLAKNIESEGILTRYGEIINDKLISPDDKYGKKEADRYLIDLKGILMILKDLLEEIPDFKQEVIKLLEFLKLLEEVIKDEPS